jgi:hypothetical protein
VRRIAKQTARSFEEQGEGVVAAAASAERQVEAAARLTNHFRERAMTTEQLVRSVEESRNRARALATTASGHVRETSQVTTEVRHLSQAAAQLGDLLGSNGEGEPEARP